MFAAGARGSVAYSKHLAVFMHNARVGLHESIVLERRGGALRGVGLFARDALDAGTSVAVVPNDRLVCSESLRSIGCNYPLSLEAKSRLFVEKDFENDFSPSPSPSSSSRHEGRSSRSLISELLGCSEDAEWVELAWRIGLERCGSHSFWWGWLDGLPSEGELDDIHRACGVAVQSRFPELAGELKRFSDRVRCEIDGWYARLEVEVPMPPKAVFEWAVRVVLSRASILIRPRKVNEQDGAVDSNSNSNSNSSGSTVFTRELGILPVIDACNTSNTAFVGGYEERLEAFIDDAFAKAAAANIVLKEGEGLPASLGEDRLRGAFLQLESRENPYFYGSTTLSSTMRLGRPMLSSAAASEIAIDKAVVEIAPSWDALPRWYQELIVAGTLETERASEIGMTSKGAVREPSLSSSVGLFPAFVLTLSRDVRAGEEILMPYDDVKHTRTLSSLCGANNCGVGEIKTNPNAERAMRIWLRYGISI